MPNDKLQIRLNPEQKARLLAIAEARQVTQTDVIKDAIAEQWFRLKEAGNGLAVERKGNPAIQNINS